MQQRTQSQLTNTKNSDIDDVTQLLPSLEPINSSSALDNDMPNPTYEGEKGFLESVQLPNTRKQ